MRGISRWDQATFARTVGVYGHLPRHGYVGYVRLVTKRSLFTLWYMGNPYRPWRVVEKCARQSFVDRR